MSGCHRPPCILDLVILWASFNVAVNTKVQKILKLGLDLGSLFQRVLLVLVYISFSFCSLTSNSVPDAHHLAWLSLCEYEHVSTSLSKVSWVLKTLSQSRLACRTHV